MNRHYYQIARDHWKNFLPLRFKELVKAGTLQQSLVEAANQTELEMSQAEEAGIPRDQAWEEIRGRYLLPTPEQEEPEREDNPKARTLNEAISGLNDFYDQQ